MINKQAASGQLAVAAGWASETGPRPANEDYVAVRLPEPGDAHGVIGAVCDGVGGQAGGRTAAELAVRGFIDGCLGQSEILPVRQTGARSLAAINRWIHAMGRLDPALKHMSCTFTGVVLRGRRMHLLHVGDTRLYRLRAGQLAQLTRDHRPEGGAVRNLLTRAVGAEEGVRMDYLEEPLEAHDRLLICSDGLFEALPERRLLQELGRRSGAEQTARRLVAAALEAGSQDNATALVLDVLELPGASAVDIRAGAASLPMVEPPRAGALVDGFRLDEMLADGRYSRVFRAEDEAGGGPAVLLKFPKPDAIGAEAAARAAFLRETWVATRVRSPWIGAVLELPPGRQTALYLAQPYYAGETLERRLLRHPPISVAAGQEIALKLAKGVAALHRAGVIHRDIKPENIILEPGGGVRLIDLGVARLPHLDEGVNDVPGTPSYMAPELFAGAPADEQTDLFALGATLYRMFSAGAYPYGEIEPFTHPRFRRPTPLSDRRPDLPAWLEAAVMRAVAADPDARHGDAVELAFELEAGQVTAAPARATRLPLIERDPLRFWQLTAIVLFLLLLASLAS